MAEDEYRKETSSRWLGNWIIRRAFKLIGHPFDSQPNVHFFLILFTNLLLSVILIIGQFLPWESEGFRFSAIEDLNVVAFSALLQIEFLFAPDRLQNVIDIQEQITLVHPLKISEAQNDENIKYKQLDRNAVLRIILTCFSYSLMGAVLPGLHGLYKINFGNVENINENEIPMPFNPWLPITIKNNKNFIPISIFQVGVQWFIAWIYIGWFMLILSSLLNIANDLKILTLFVEEIDSRIRSGELFEWDSTNKNSMSLKIYMAWIIEYHNAIIRSVEKFNKNTTATMLVFNQMVVIEFCIPLFCVLEVQENAIRAQFFVLLIIDTIVFTYFSSFGQLIIDESNNFYMALEFSSWPDKPKWFKKYLSIMITSAQKPLQIKPAGLYTLDLHNIMMIMNAGYSYLSLMRTIKDT